MKMIKREKKKEDGRYIIFYEFDEIDELENTNSRDCNDSTKSNNNYKQDNKNSGKLPGENE